MKITIRNGVFETNSSSVHSIVILKTDSNESESYNDEKDVIELEENAIPISNEGYVWGNFGVYDRNYMIFEKQGEKLGYLLTLCYYASFHDFDRMLDSSCFKRIESAVCEYTGAKGIKFSTKVINKIRKIEMEDDYWNDYCYIDHQSVPCGQEIDFIDTYDNNAIIRFIWGKGVCLETSGD